MKYTLAICFVICDIFGILNVFIHAQSFTSIFEYSRTCDDITLSTTVQSSNNLSWSFSWMLSDGIANLTAAVITVPASRSAPIYVNYTTSNPYQRRLVISHLPAIVAQLSTPFLSIITLSQLQANESFVFSIAGHQSKKYTKAACPSNFSGNRNVSSVSCIASSCVCGSSATLFCSHGIQVFASCLPTGKYSQRCLVECPVNSVGIHLQATIGEGTVGLDRVVIYECSRSYLGNGATYKCKEDGTMSLASARDTCVFTTFCFADSLNDPTLQAVGNVTRSKVGEELAFNCTYGYTGTGATYKCEKSGRFLRKTLPAYCQAVTCSVSLYGNTNTKPQTSAKRVLFGQNVHYECTTGYTGQGATYTCSINTAMVFSSAPPSCVQVTCRVAAIPDKTIQAYLSATVINYNHRFRFLCKVGYRGVGATYYCSNIGQLELVTPPADCKKITCSTLFINDPTIRPTNAELLVDFNVRVNFQCKSLYQGVGATYVCNSGGRLALVTSPAICIEKVFNTVNGANDGAVENNAGAGGGQNIGLFNGIGGQNDVSGGSSDQMSIGVIMLLVILSVVSLIVFVGLCFKIPTICRKM